MGVIPPIEGASTFRSWVTASLFRTTSLVGIFTATYTSGLVSLNVLLCAIRRISPTGRLPSGLGLMRLPIPTMHPLSQKKLRQWRLYCCASMFVYNLSIKYPKFLWIGYHYIAAAGML